jgi:hypothetical protein
VNFNGRPDSNAAQFVSFAVKRVHSDFLHQANKGNEEFCPAPAAALLHREIFLFFIFTGWHFDALHVINSRVRIIYA